MSGALVGSVIDDPKVLDHARGVSVTIIVYEPIKVAHNASVVVGSSGLLGDRFVDIIPKRDDEGGYYQAGDTVQGTRAQGMEELQREGGLLVGDLRDTVATLHKTVTRIDEELLKEQTFKDLQAALANLRVTTENFRATSEKLSGVIDDAHGVVTKAGDAMGGAKDTLGTAKAAAEDVRGGDWRRAQGARIGQRRHRSGGAWRGAAAHAHFGPASLRKRVRSGVKSSSQRRPFLQRPARHPRLIPLRRLRHRLRRPAPHNPRR